MTQKIKRAVCHGIEGLGSSSRLGQVRVGVSSRLGAERRGSSSRLGPDRRGGVCHHGWCGPAWLGASSRLGRERGRIGLSLRLGQARQGRGTVQHGLSSWLGMRGSESARVVTAAWIVRGQIRHGCHHGLGWIGMAWHGPSSRLGSARPGWVSHQGLAWFDSSSRLGSARLGLVGKGVICHRGLGRLGSTRHHGLGWRGRNRTVIMAWAGKAERGSRYHHGLGWPGRVWEGKVWLVIKAWLGLA